MGTMALRQAPRARLQGPLAAVDSRLQEAHTGTSRYRHAPTTSVHGCTQSCKSQKLHVLYVKKHGLPSLLPGRYGSAEGIMTAWSSLPC